METKQAEACYFKVQPALAGFVSSDPDLELGANSANRQVGKSANWQVGVVNSTTDPRSVSVETKQAEACYFKVQPALAGFVFSDPDFESGDNFPSRYRAENLFPWQVVATNERRSPCQMPLRFGLSNVIMQHAARR